MLKIVAVLPAKRGLTGASIALVNVLLGIVRVYGGKVRVSVITSADALKYPTVRRLCGEGATCSFLRIDRYPSPIYWLLLAVRLLLSGRHDVAHFSTPKTLLFLYPVAQLVSRKIVLTLEGYPPYELKDSKASSRIIGMVAWLSGLRLADRVAACSDWLRRVTVHTYGFGSKVSVIHNPIEYDRFSGDTSRAGGPLVITARLHRVKGVDTALRALAEIKRSSNKAPKLIVLGDGPERGRLEKLADELGISDQVEFLGHKHHVERWVKSAGAVLVPSRYEPFGMPAAEAGAAGKPVVASATGGLSEIIVDGVTGLLFKPGDYAELADRINRLLSDEEGMRRMGERARERVLRNFTPETIAPKMLRLYIEALSEQ
ncbi:MAG: glycosyltransferase family 4 protein [Nitrososphaerota archaeon]|nr:glycosyltransferase family 4 protein [Candidatus Calditenuaceae archaeon]MDW8073631.1 glycosyltransferase family 4 protein [Nitrososphaerota archaeon]